MHITLQENTLLSVCVPTYNRSAMLKDFFESIGRDYLDMIEIVIVDDGSTDDTDSLCRKYKNKLNVVYSYQENRGRSYALKQSILSATGLFVIIMDSDDVFTDDGIKVVIDYILKNHEYLNNNDIAGLVFLCGSKNGVIGKSFRDDWSIGNMLKDVADLRVIGDKKEVIKSELLKRFMYQGFRNEKRMATSILWNRISAEYNVININRIVAHKDYHSDGLTKNINSVRMMSSRSSSLFYCEALSLHGTVYSSYRYAIKMSINLLRYSWHSSSMSCIGKLDMSGKNVLFLSFSLPFSYFLYLHDKVLHRVNSTRLL